MAAGFIADTASLPLVVSNLVNIVSADYFKLGFTDYAAIMAPVNIVSVLASLVVLMLYFRRDIPAHYRLEQLRAPAEAIKDMASFKAGWIVLALLLTGFLHWNPWVSPSVRLPQQAPSFCWRLPPVAQSSAHEKCCVAPPGKSSCSRWACIWWFTACAMPG